MSDWKKQIYIFLQRFLNRIIFIAAIIIVVMAVLLTLVRALTPILDKHHRSVENLIGQIIHKPITIGSLGAGWHGFLPVIELNDVTVYNAVTQPLLHVNHLSMGIHLWRSLLAQHLEIDYLNIDGTKISVQSDARHIVISGANQNPILSFNLNSSQKNASMPLFLIERLHLKNIDLTWKHNQNALSHFYVHDIVNAQIQLQNEKANMGKLTLHMLKNEIQQNYFAQKNIKISLNTTLYWHKTNKNIFFNLEKISLKTPAVILNGKAKINFQNTDWLNPRIILDFNIPKVDLSQFKNYLPQPLQHNKKLYRWLQSAFVAGELFNSRLEMDDNYKDLTSKESKDNKKVLVNFSGQFSKVAFNYNPKWPMLENAEGTFNLYHRTLNVQIAKGIYDHAKIIALHASIPELRREKFLLNIITCATGNLEQGQDFLMKTPLYHSIGKHLQALKAQGPFTLNLYLTIPVGDHHAKVFAKGNLSSQDAKLTLIHYNLHLNHLIGTLNFVGSRLNANNLQGAFLGEPIKVHIDSRKLKTQVTMNGYLNTHQIQKHFSFPMIDYLRGSTLFSVNLTYNKKGLNTVLFHSNLVGMSSLLPSPLNKTDQSSWPLEVLINGFNTHKIKVLGDLNHFIHFNSDFGNYYKLTFAGSKIEGFMFLPKKIDKNTTVSGTFKKLYIEATEEKNEASDFELSLMPKLNIHIDDLHFNQIHTGLINLQTHSILQGILIDNFSVANNHFQLQSSGYWHKQNGKNETNLKGSLQADNIASVLKHLGIKPNIYAEKFSSHFDFNWNDTPFHFAKEKLQGYVDVYSGVGVIKHLSSRAQDSVSLGEMLTFFSLSSLEKRIRLNFSDMANSGYNFERLDGKLFFKQGIMSTDHFIIKGMVADINFTGSLDLLQKTMDFYVQVLPHLTSSLPVIATLAAGPIVGAVTWLANEIAAPAISQMAERDYEVKGTWNQPIWYTVT